MEFFAGLETNGFAGSDTDFSASARITADAGFTRSDAENAESAQFYAVARGKRLLEPFEYGVYRCLSLGPRQACPLDHVMDNILLDQSRSPLVEEFFSACVQRPIGRMLLGVGGVVNLRLLQYHKALRHYYPIF